MLPSMQRFAPLVLRSLALTILLAALCDCAPAQNKGEPGKFDFYLMNLAWSPEFCRIDGVSPQCQAELAGHRGFTMHGLWAQNNDGSYPVFCSEDPGPATPAHNLDITPDLALLAHEWAKHGTCSAVGPQRFFTLERQALHALKIPRVFQRVDQETSMTPAAILTVFQTANPAFPPGSILLSCADNHLTAVEACFSKDLKPTVCQGLKSCTAASVKIGPPTAITH